MTSYIVDQRKLRDRMKSQLKSLRKFNTNLYYLSKEKESIKKEQSKVRNKFCY